VITVHANGKTAMVEKLVAMIELGIVTGVIEEVGVTEVTEMIAEQHDAIRGVMISTDHHEGTGIFSRVAWTEIVVGVVADPQETTETNLQCRWEAERRVPVLHQKRRSLRLI